MTDLLRRGRSAIARAIAAQDREEMDDFAAWVMAPRSYAAERARFRARLRAALPRLAEVARALAIAERLLVEVSHAR